MKIFDKAYQCEFCKKLYVVEKACKKHEIFCSKNPGNKHACFHYCKHLVKERISHGDHYYGYCTTYFYCNKLNKELYSYIAERRNLDEDIRNGADAERMPLACAEYEDKDGFKGFPGMTENVGEFFRKRRSW